MAQLSSIIGSILRDMVLAQHQANLYATSLSPLYGKGAALERYPLPSIALGEMELDLCYGISSEADTDSDGGQQEINYSSLRKHLQRLSVAYADKVVGAVCEIMRKLFPLETLTGENPLSKFETSESYRKQIESFLSHKILEDLRQEFTRLIDETDGTLRRDVVRTSVLDTCKRELLNHADLENIFDKMPESKEQVAYAIETAVETVSDTMLPGISIMRKRLLPSLDVVVASEELGDLPGDYVHRLHLKISPRELPRYLDLDE